MYQEIEVHIYRKEVANIKSMVNISTIRNYHGIENDRTKILFASIDFIVIDESFDKFKERMSHLNKDYKDV